MNKVKKIAISIATSSLLATSLFSANILNVKSGWTLYGLDDGISDLNKTFSKYSNEIKTIWKYDSNVKAWRVYSPNSEIKDIISNGLLGTVNSINPREGFWINSNSDIMVSLDNNITIITPEQNITDNNITTLGEEKYNVCKSSKFGTLSNISSDTIPVYDISNPFSFIDTGVDVSTTNENYNLFYNHIVYNNDLPSNDMYLNIDGNYFGKVKFKSEYLGKSFVLTTEDKRYLGVFEKYNNTPYELKELDKSSENYPPIIDIEKDSVTITKIKNETLKIAYCDQNNDTLSFSSESNDTSIVNTEIEDNNITLIAESEGNATVKVTIDDGENQIDKSFDVNSVNIKDIITNEISVDNPILNNGDIVKMYTNIESTNYYSNNPYPIPGADDITLRLNILDINNTKIDSVYSYLNIDNIDAKKNAYALIKIVDENNSLVWESNVTSLHDDSYEYEDYNNKTYFNIDFVDENGRYNDTPKIEKIDDINVPVGIVLVIIHHLIITIMMVFIYLFMIRMNLHIA